MKNSTTLWGVTFVTAAGLGIALLAFHIMKWDREYTLLDQPMRVVASRTITNMFTVPASAPYGINIYVRSEVPYADCLLGQSGYLEERCRRYRSVIDIDWLVHDKDGGVLRKGASTGSCCTYTSDEYRTPVVFVSLGDFRLPAGTTAYLELRHGRDLSKLERLAPRVVLQRSDPEESELGVVLWSMVGIIALLLIGLLLLITTLITVLAEYRASRADANSSPP